MHYSGVLVVVPRSQIDEMGTRIQALPGMEVRFSYPESGRLIVVLETDTVEGQQEGLRRLKALPGVVMAEAVYHHVDTEGEPPGGPAGEGGSVGNEEKA